MVRRVQAGPRRAVLRAAELLDQITAWTLLRSLKTALALALFVLPFASGCAGECSTTDSVEPSPSPDLLAIDRVISCGGAAGSLDHEVILRAGGPDPSEKTVVETTGAVHSLTWQGPQTLVVGVDAVDEIGDPVSEHVESWSYRAEGGSVRRVAVRLERLTRSR